MNNRGRSGSDNFYMEISNSNDDNRQPEVIISEFFENVFGMIFGKNNNRGIYEEIHSIINEIFGIITQHDMEEIKSELKKFLNNRERNFLEFILRYLVENGNTPPTKIHRHSSMKDPYRIYPSDPDEDDEDEDPPLMEDRPNNFRVDRQHPSEKGNTPPIRFFGFVNRYRELREILEKLTHENRRLLIFGVGGIGKSAIAQLLAVLLLLDALIKKCRNIGYPSKIVLIEKADFSLGDNRHRKGFAFPPFDRVKSVYDSIRRNKSQFNLPELIYIPIYDDMISDPHILYREIYHTHPPLIKENIEKINDILEGNIHGDTIRTRVENRSSLKEIQTNLVNKIVNDINEGKIFLILDDYHLTSIIIKSGVSSCKGNSVLLSKIDYGPRDNLAVIKLSYIDRGYFEYLKDSIINNIGFQQNVIKKLVNNNLNRNRKDLENRLHPLYIKMRILNICKNLFVKYNRDGDITAIDPLEDVGNPSNPAKDALIAYSGRIFGDLEKSPFISFCFDFIYYALNNSNNNVLYSESLIGIPDLINELRTNTNINRDNFLELELVEILKECIEIYGDLYNSGILNTICRQYFPVPDNNNCTVEFKKYMNNMINLLLRSGLFCGIGNNNGIPNKIRPAIPEFNKYLNYYFQFHKKRGNRHINMRIVMHNLLAAIYYYNYLRSLGNDNIRKRYNISDDYIVTTQFIIKHLITFLENINKIANNNQKTDRINNLSERINQINSYLI